MKRTTVDRSYLRPRPVKKIELNERHTRLRLVLAACGILAATVAIVFCAIKLFAVEDGWREIDTNGSGTTYADEIVLSYNLGAAGISAAAENRSLVSAYTSAMELAYKLFNPNETVDGVLGISYINEHPNTDIQVNEYLYTALKKLDASGYIYLTPVLKDVESVLMAQSDSEAACLDPERDETESEFVSAYINARDGLRLIFKEGNTVNLSMNEAYIAFSEEWGVTRHIDLCYCKNAAVIDMVYACLTDAGFTLGCLSSADGFVRGLGDIYFTQSPYEQTVLSGSMAASAVNTSAYVYENGDKVTPYILYSSARQSVKHSSGMVYGNAGCIDMFIDLYSYVTEGKTPQYNLAAQ